VTCSEPVGGFGRRALAGRLRRGDPALVRLAGLEEPSTEIADAVEPAGGVALRRVRHDDYFFLDLPLPPLLDLPLAFAAALSALFASAHSSP
jgi:hypothetical protein